MRALILSHMYPRSNYADGGRLARGWGFRPSRMAPRGPISPLAQLKRKLLEVELTLSLKALNLDTSRWIGPSSRAVQRSILEGG
jgi:hypothetical protein